MISKTVKLNKKKVKNLKDLKLYEFDDRHVSDAFGKVFLIKEDTDTKFIGYPMSPFITSDGYVEYVLTDINGSKKHIQAQRIVAGLYLAHVEGKDYVNHKNGKKQDNHYSNLEYTTASENIKHTFDVLKRVQWNKGKTNS